MNGDYRISAVALDERVRGHLTPEIETERDIAIRDLLEKNHFRPVGSPGGPYQLVIGLDDGRVVLQLFLEDGTPHGTAFLSGVPYRRIIGRYFKMCESFAFAESGARLPDQVEAIDMARRALHDEGAKLLMDRLNGKVEMDIDTARGIFTLICMLHLKS